jgi:arylsulfatase A-like enzyme
LFTSDNGPWYLGSTGRLRGRKGSTYEGGVRVPFIARFPGRVPAGAVSTALASGMDVLPTIAALAGVSIAPESTDGVDLWPVLKGDQRYVEREALLFFDGWELQCVRWGPWKLHLTRYNTPPWTADPPGGRVNLPLAQPELYNIDADPGESYDLSSEKPDVVADLKARVEKMMLSLPDEARAAWQATLARRVQPSPTGSLPQPGN